MLQRRLRGGVRGGLGIPTDRAARIGVRSRPPLHDRHDATLPHDYARRRALASCHAVGTSQEDGEERVVSEGVASPADVLASRRERFVLFPDEAAMLMERMGNISMDDLLRELTMHTGDLALPPISNFRVSCAGLGTSGNVYVGVNVEFEGLPLPCSLHAEQFMILNAFQHGEERLTHMAVSHAPCGHCRQFMSELVGSDALGVHIVNADHRASVPEVSRRRRARE